MKKLPILLLAAATILLLSGCNSIPKVGLKDMNAQNLQGKTLTYVVYAKKQFGAGTPGTAVGFLGANAAAKGRKMVKKYNLKDPALYISHALVQFLSQRYEKATPLL